MILPLKDGTDYEIPNDLINDLLSCYPGIDLNTELGRMRGWLLCNPSRRKTKRGIKKFINGWLSRCDANISQSVSPMKNLTDTSWAQGLVDETNRLN